jgi:hypothetical protein
MLRDLYSNRFNRSPDVTTTRHTLLLCATSQTLKKKSILVAYFKEILKLRELNLFLLARHKTDRSYLRQMISKIQTATLQRLSQERYRLTKLTKIRSKCVLSLAGSKWLLLQEMFQRTPRHSSKTCNKNSRCTPTKQRS